MNVLRDATNYVTGALGLGSSGETSGALDIMVVQHEDGSMSCTPFHVRFSKVHPTNRKERVIQLRVNGRTVPLCMKLGVAGEAFFVERVHSTLRRDLATSPISSPLHGEDGHGEERQQWKEATVQDDWESRQLQNYQLLSDLSSDEEAASHRDSNHDLAARILSASRSFSPGKEAGGPAFSNDASAQLDRRKDEVAAPAVAPDPDVGAIEVSCSPTGAITSFSSSSDRGRRSHGVPTVIAKNATNAGVEASVGAISESTSMAVAPVDEGPALSRAASSLAKATESSNNSQEREEARSSILGGSGGGGVEAKGGEKEGENNQVGEHRKEEGEDDDKGGDGGGGDDGDEEDNADDGEGYDTVGEDGFGGSGGGGGGDVSCAGRAGEARVGDEGRWWWSWTWGALPVRKKPKSTRRKHHHHHNHHARRTKMKRGASESLVVGDSAFVEGKRSVRAATEPLFPPSADFVDDELRAAAETDADRSNGAQVSQSALSPAPCVRSDTPVKAQSDDDGREAKARNIAPIGREGQNVAGEGRIVGGEVGHDRHGGPASPASRVEENGAGPLAAPGDAADVEQRAVSGDTLESEGARRPVHPDNVDGSHLLSPSTLNDITGTSEGGLRGGDTVVLSASPATKAPAKEREAICATPPFPVVESQPDRAGALRMDPDGVVTASESIRYSLGNSGDEAGREQSSSSPTGGALMENATGSDSCGGSVVPNTGTPSLEAAVERGGLLPPPVAAVAAAVLAKEEEKARLSDVDVPCQSSDALALTRLLLSDRRDSASFQSGAWGDKDEDIVDGELPLTLQISPQTNDDAALRIATTSLEGKSGSAEGLPEPILDPPCVFPGDEDSGMNQLVVAVETLSPSAEAWLSGGPAAEAAVAVDNAGIDSAVPPPPLPPPSPSALARRGDSVGGRGDGGGDSGKWLSQGIGNGHTLPQSTGEGYVSGVEAAALLASAPAAGGVGIKTLFSAAPRPVGLPPTVTSGPCFPSGSSADVRAPGDIGVRISSVAELRGFHTPHGGSSSDLTTMFPGGVGSAPESVGLAPHEGTPAVLGLEFDSLATGASSPLLSPSTGKDEATVADVHAASQVKGQTASGEGARGGLAIVGPDVGSNQARVGARMDAGQGRHADRGVRLAMAVMAAETGGGMGTEQSPHAGDTHGERKAKSVEISSGTIDGGGPLSREIATAASALEDPETVAYGNETGLTATTMTTGRESGGKDANRAAAMTRDAWSPPELSLSGHLIGPETRQGGETGEVEWVRDTFAREAVAWDDFARYPQEILQDPRLLVAIEGRLMNLLEALPHLVAASVFGKSLLTQQASPRGARGILSQGFPPAAACGPDGSISVALAGAGDQEEADVVNGREDNAKTDGDGMGRGGDKGGLAPIPDTVHEGVDIARPTIPGSGVGSGDGASTADVSPMKEVGAARPTSAVTSAASAAGAVVAEDEAAAGLLWGLSGWFSSRRLSIPPQPAGTVPLSPPPESGAAASQNKEAGGPRGGNGASAGGHPLVRVKEMTAAVQQGTSLEAARGGDVPAPVPAPLSTDPAKQGRYPDEGYATDTDEDADMYGKTLRPTSEQLAALKLRAGCNTVEFVVKVAGQAERVVAARVFLWGGGAKVVISDVENTIARSGSGPGMGSFTPVVGPGVHKDVSTLLTKITSNGYKILYLTNRPLPDWHAKKSGADGALPRGPVLCPPEVLFRSTFSSKDRHSHQEVFKMTALRGLKLIFPADVNPLYAGFGNSVSDMVAFKKMSVPEGRIFLIDSSGDLHSINHTYRQTLMSLSLQADLTFPALPCDGADDSFDGVNNPDPDRAIAAADVSGGVITGATTPGGTVRDSVDGGEEKGVGSGGVAGVAIAVDRSVGDDAAAAGEGASGRGGVARSGWKEVITRREKSFYPNRAAVEDQFTDLNFWRDPPPLIGDDDEDDDEDFDDEEEDEDEEDKKEEGVLDAGRAPEDFAP